MYFQLCRLAFSNFCLTMSFFMCWNFSYPCLPSARSTETSSQMNQGCQQRFSQFPRTTGFERCIGNHRQSKNHCNSPGNHGIDHHHIVGRESVENFLLVVSDFVKNLTVVVRTSIKIFTSILNIYLHRISLPRYQLPNKEVEGKFPLSGTAWQSRKCLGYHIQRSSG